MAETSSTLVLGAAMGYGIPEVWVFVESLRRHYAGDIALQLMQRLKAHPHLEHGHGRHHQRAERDENGEQTSRGRRPNSD